MRCHDGCCTIEMKDLSYPIKKPKRIINNRIIKKAGVFIYDPTEERVVLVQSRGQLWGVPKGTIENETIPECAIRELKEETGIDMKVDDFIRATKIKNRAIYYYTEMKTIPIHIPNNLEDNDSTGLTWIKINCLKKLLNGGQIILNNHTKEVFKKFLGIILPKAEFIKV